jgi:hypothetical protein
VKGQTNVAKLIKDQVSKSGKVSLPEFCNPKLGNVVIKDLAGPTTLLSLFL